jgi:hypothetical protein
VKLLAFFKCKTAKPASSAGRLVQNIKCKNGIGEGGELGNNKHYLLQVKPHALNPNDFYILNFTFYILPVF